MGPVPHRVARAGEHTSFFKLHYLIGSLTIFIFCGLAWKALAHVTQMPVLFEGKFCCVFSRLEYLVSYNFVEKAVCCRDSSPHY